jgi:hypothetical protein
MIDHKVALELTLYWVTTTRENTIAVRHLGIAFIQ